MGHGKQTPLAEYAIPDGARLFIQHSFLVAVPVVDPAQFCVALHITISTGKEIAIIAYTNSKTFGNMGLQ